MSATDFVKGFITGQLALLGLLLVILRLLFFRGVTGFNSNRNAANGLVLIDSRQLPSMKVDMQLFDCSHYYSDGIAAGMTALPVIWN